MNIHTILYGIALVLGLAAMAVGVLSILRRDSDLMPVALLIIVATGIVMVVALVLNRLQR
ncbi:MAG: hypothetical protein GY703_11340 [Gammaproteobacteria bacterium]|nr:hypothetical protein [Gammaproteobacteria bacterium]